MSTQFRPLAASDSDNLFRWRNSPDVARFMYTDDPIPRAAHDAWLAGALADTRRKYWVIAHAGADVGLLNLYDIDTKNSKATWAFYIGDPSQRGAGIGSAAETFIIYYAFGVLKLNKLSCEVLAFNKGVCRLHERFGFVQEGFLKSHIQRSDGFHDVVVYGMINPRLAEHANARR